jgi:hypothetical protein
MFEMKVRLQREASAYAAKIRRLPTRQAAEIIRQYTSLSLKKQ